MAAERIGQAPCPLCRAPGAVSLSIRGLAVFTCTHPDCKCQIFARGPGSDETIRDSIAAKAPAVPAPAPAIEPKPAPPSLPTLTIKKPPTAVPEPGSIKLPPKARFGMLKSW